MWLEILQDIKGTYIVGIQHLNYFIFFAYPFINKKKYFKKYANPKSAIFGWIPSNSIFEGFRSLCTTPILTISAYPNTNFWKSWNA
jgi:hypothetical protein